MPGTSLRIPVAGRSDIPAILTSVYTRAKSPRPDAASISIGCVPLKSPLLSGDGQNLIEGIEAATKAQQGQESIDPGDADKSDLFTYGTVARISGVQGRRTDDLALILEGTRRLKIERFTQTRPYFEARVTYLDEERTFHRREVIVSDANSLYSCRHFRRWISHTIRSLKAALSRASFAGTDIIASATLSNESVAVAGSSNSSVR